MDRRHRGNSTTLETSGLQSPVMSLPISPPTQFAATTPEEDGHALRLVAALNPHCVVCGHQNPHGLQLTFRVDGNGVTAEWVPGKNWESFQGVIHGGVISTVLDEAMSKAIIAQGLEAFTVDLRVRFKQKAAYRRDGVGSRLDGAAPEAQDHSGSEYLQRLRRRTCPCLGRLFDSSATFRSHRRNRASRRRYRRLNSGGRALLPKQASENSLG